MKKIFFILTILLPFICEAQVNISVQLPPGGSVQKSQLWNLVVINNRDDISDLNIRLTLQDASTGESLLSANTGTIPVGKGVKIISQNDVQPLMYNYTNADFSKDFLPIGSYTACYRAYHNGRKGEEPLGDECIKINIDPLSPPLLSSPADTSVIETPYPQFTWMPPAPINMFSNLNYEINICEVKEGQKPLEAVTYNLPVYTKSNITIPSDNYSSSYTALVPGKTYAWYVTALNGISYAAKTDIWTFTVAPKVADTKVISESYIQLGEQSEKSTLYTVSKNELTVKFYSTAAAYHSKILLADANGKILKEFEKEISYGENFISIPITGKFDKNVIYTITLYDADKTAYTAAFTIIP